MIRRARPDDADALAETFIASFETLLRFLPDLHTRDEHRRFITETVPRDHEVWVAEEDGRVVGLAARRREHARPHLRHPDFHGRGLGTALLEQDEGAAAGRLHALDVPANEQACRFYERHGLRAIEYGDGSGNEEGVPGCPVRVAARLARREASAAACSRIERAITSRWISLVPS